MAEQHDQHRDYRSGKYTGFNTEWYDKLRASKPNWEKVSEVRVHPNRGIPVHVKAGQIFRSIIPDGSNIIDPDLLPDEHHWPVWHGGHCSPELNQAGYNILEHASCHTNALEALVIAGYDFDMAEKLASTHNMCIFQPMGVTNQQMDAGHISPTWHNVPSHLKPGTFVDYYAEMDLFLPISHCPYGDQSGPPHEADHYPVDIEIWDTGIKPQERPPWNDWRPAFKKRLERLKKAGHTGATGRYYKDD